MRTKIARVALLVGLVWAAEACAFDRLTEVNENPNQLTDVPAKYVLPQAIQSAVYAAYGDWQCMSHSCVWAQHLVRIQYPQEERGIVLPVAMDAFWNNYYAGPLRDLQTVIDKGVAEGKPNHQAVGMIMKEWVFHILTDYYGDIPYSQALSVDSIITTPVYDTQQSIYAGMLAHLTTAAEMLDPDGAGFGDGDLLYSNDFVAWRRFANSLRMRLAMRLSGVDPATARAEFVAAYSAGGFTSNADNAVLEYPGAPYENPLYVNYLSRDDHAVSATMIDTLLSLNDPRLELYAEPALEDGVYRGHHNGMDDIPPPLTLASISRIGNFWRADGAATPTIVMSYAEVLFLEAEAAFRGWIAADPATLYTAAIQANMDQYDGYGAVNNPTDAEVAAYLAQPRVVYTPANGLNQIYLQEWIALWMSGPEAWSHVRRTDVPHLLPGPHLIISRIPVRLPYPPIEQSLNRANLEAAVQRQGGGNDLITWVWWDPH